MGLLMPMDHVTALAKARNESGCMAAVLMIDTLPSLLSNEGIEAYAGGLRIVHRLLKGWESYDGFVCRRAISAKARQLCALERPIPEQYRKSLKAMLA